MKEDKTVFPGSELAQEEEYLPGANTFIKKGIIYSDSVGEKETDMKERKVGVKKINKILKPKTNDIVYGKIVQIKESYAIIEIYALKRNNTRQFFKFSSGILPVSNVSFDYVSDLRELLKKGDIVKAKIDLIDKFGLKLKLKGTDLGVILSHCSECKAPLILSNRHLKCKKCLAEATRKIANDSYILKL